MDTISILICTHIAAAIVGGLGVKYICKPIWFLQGYQDCYNHHGLQETEKEKS